MGWKYPYSFSNRFLGNIDSANECDLYGEHHANIGAMADDNANPIIFYQEVALIGRLIAYHVSIESIFISRDSFL